MPTPSATSIPPDELRRLDPARPASLAEMPSCLSAYDPDALPVRDAQRIIREFVTPVHADEQVALRAALGRVLALDVDLADQRAGPRQLGDGWLCAARRDLSADGRVRLRVIGTVYAGRAFDDAVPAKGECVRIMTGGVMPAGCDSVVPQELRAEDDGASSGAGHHPRRRQPPLAGEDLKAGSAALRGPVIRPSDLGLLASLGVAEVPVQRRLRVAFFSTGDELRSIGQPLDQGCVYDSNRYTIYGMLQRLGCDIIDMGVVRDDPQALEAGAARGLRERRRHHHLGRRLGRRGRLHASRSWRAWATSPSGRSACAPAARWRSAASPRTAAAPSCSGCPAIRWR
jgi:molybdopterin molybdotransferase